MKTNNETVVTTDDIMRGIDLSGKTAVITGATSGLGQESARALAAAGARIMIAARDPAKISATVAQLQSQVPTAEIQSIVMDLADLASVAHAAQRITHDIDRIDILMNNAGIMAIPEERSVDGIEMQFAANYVGHFLLTRSLMPLLRASNDARIVNMSSGGHKLAPVFFDDYNFEKQGYGKWRAYGQAKTAMCLFGVALTKRYGDQDITANAVNPGPVLTSLGRHMTRDDIKEMVKGSDMTKGKIRYQSPAEGAATQVWAATSPALEGRSGLYLEKCGIAEVLQENHGSEEGVMSYALDPEAADRLWELSEELTKGL